MFLRELLANIFCPLPNDHVRLHTCRVGGSHDDSDEKSNPLVHDVVVAGNQHSPDCPEK